MHKPSILSLELNCILLLEYKLYITNTRFVEPKHKLNWKTKWEFKNLQLNNIHKTMDSNIIKILCHL